LDLVVVVGALAGVFPADIAAVGPVRWLGSAAESLATAGFGYPAPVVSALASAFVWLSGRGGGGVGDAHLRLSRGAVRAVAGILS
jgi:hypothetical protein